MHRPISYLPRKLSFWVCSTKQYTSFFLLSFWRLFHSHHKKRKDSLEGSLDWLLFVVELEFPKVLVPRLPQNSSNVNTTVFFMWPASWSTDISSFCYSGINLFLIDYACCKLCIIWLLILENNSRSYHYTGVSHWRKNIIAVINNFQIFLDKQFFSWLCRFIYIYIYQLT